MDTLTLDWRYTDDIGQAFAHGTVKVTSDGMKVRHSLLEEIAADVITNIAKHDFENLCLCTVGRIVHVTADDLGPEYFVKFTVGE